MGNKYDFDVNSLQSADIIIRSIVGPKPSTEIHNYTRRHDAVSRQNKTACRIILGKTRVAMLMRFFNVIVIINNNEYTIRGLD